VLKTEGVAGIIRKALDREEIMCMFIYGSFARTTAGAKSDIDLFIVGTVDEDRLIPIIHSCEHATGQEINYTLMTAKELEKRKKRKDPFVKNVMLEEKILISGTCDDCGY
jgi:predicted nucleotidyltransferase